MRRLSFAIVAFVLAGCAFPSTPSETNLIAGAMQFQPELFDSGARGEIIVSLSDNVSKSGFFGKIYSNNFAFKNLQNGNVYYIKTNVKGDMFKTAMLPIGKYQATNLYLEYIYTRTYRQGNTTVTETIIERHEHFEGNNKITFDVKPGEVAYIGHIELVKGENRVDAEGAKIANHFKLSDKSSEIPEESRAEWEQKFGRPFVVRLASVGGK